MSVKAARILQSVLASGARCTCPMSRLSGWTTVSTRRIAGTYSPTSPRARHDRRGTRSRRGGIGHRWIRAQPGPARQRVWPRRPPVVHDVVVIGAGATGAGAALDAAGVGSRCPGRGRRPGRRDVVPLRQDIPRRAALSRAAQFPVSEFGAARAQPHGYPCSWPVPGRAGAVHLSTDPPVGAAVYRRRYRALTTR